MFIHLRQVIGAWLIKKLQKYGPHKVQVLGKTYEVSKDVLNPKFSYTSEFMAKHLKILPDDEVLDIGTGSGIQAIITGQIAKRVVAIDISFKAVKCARKNIKTNGLDNVVSVLQGDFFSALRTEQKFNVVLFTPPYMEGRPKTDFERALFDPDKKLARRFFREAKEYLKPDGYVQMVYSSIAEPERILKIAKELGWSYNVIAQEKTVMEKFFIYKLTIDE